jgi:hypothetical protein
MAITLAKFEATDGKSAWSALEFHRVQTQQLKFEGLSWKVVPRQGILIQGEDTVRRTKGIPDTLKKIYLQYGQNAAPFWDPGLVLAVIANESRGELMCERFEEHLRDWSFGPGQFLTSTAHDLLKGVKLFPPDVPIPKGGDPERWRRFLCDPKNTLPLIRAFLTNLNKRFNLQQDPVLLYAAYNAGSPRPSGKSEWGLVTNRPDTLDRISSWYGDAWYVLNNFEPKGVA